MFQTALFFAEGLSKVVLGHWLFFVLLVLVVSDHFHKNVFCLLSHLTLLCDSFKHKRSL